MHEVYLYKKLFDTLWIIERLITMVKILKSEMFKINRAVFLKVIIFLTILTTLTINFFIFKINEGQIDTSENVGVDILSSFSISIDFYMPIYIICILFACIYLGMDFEDKVVKNVLSVGKSRFSYLFSKIVIATLYFTLIYFVYIFSTAIIYHGFFGITSELDSYKLKIRMLQIVFLIVQFIYLICMTTMIAFVTQNASNIIMCSFAGFILEYIIAHVFLNNKINFIKKLYKYTFSAVRTELLGLTDMPALNSFSCIKIFLVPLVYSMIFIFIGFYYFKKSDID